LFPKTYSYQEVSRALNVLKYQLEQATKDIEVLKDLKERALADPFEYVRKLKTRTNEKAPVLQRIVAIPEIEWGKYQNPPAQRIAQPFATLNVATSSRHVPYVKRSVFRPTILHNLAPRKPATGARRTKTISRSYSRHTSPNASSLSLSAQVAKAAQALGPLPSSSSSASASVRAQSTDPSEYDSEDETGVSSHVTNGKGKGTTGRATVSSSMTVPGHNSINGMSLFSSPEEFIQQQEHPESIQLVDDEATVPASSARIKSEKAPRPPPTPALSQYITSTISMKPPPPRQLHKEEKDKPKPVNHNMPWSDEEQRRLEELLRIYPDEPVQAQRFNKISTALGTRTPRQVASRVQKYFIKLAKNGLPVPGRITIPPSCLPKSQRLANGPTGTPDPSKPKPLGPSSREKSVTKSKVKKNGSSSSHHVKPSNGVSVVTLVPSTMRTSNAGYNVAASGGITNTRISGTHYLHVHAPPTVLMSDNDDDADIREVMMGVDARQQAVGHLEPVQLLSHKGNLDEGDELTRLKKLAKQQSREHQGYYDGVDDVVHQGYRCDGCGIEPIVGIRYKCAECDVNQEVDLCGDCMRQGGFQNEHHPTTHRFEEILVTEASPYYADHDYTEESYNGEYSYLGFGATA
ncbi:hypothetical protein BC938DRAFT_473310, partial [Jimgerdemannia flammicorona]